MNRQSKFDGLCPKGKMYDVKSSKLHFLHSNSNYFWKFNSTEEQLNKSDYFFLGAYDAQHEKLMFMWRVDKNFMRNRKYINIGKDNNYEHNTINMKKYDITDKFKHLDMDKLTT